jgi:hypothetical protein
MFLTTRAPPAEEAAATTMPDASDAGVAPADVPTAPPATTPPPVNE